jgi:serralysin
MPSFQNGYTQTSTVTVPLTGVNSTDALLGGTQWGARVGGGISITYSFPWASSTTAYWASNPNYSTTDEPSSAFALTVSQQAFVRLALASWGNVANITFTEVAESASNMGDLRIAWTNKTDTNAAAWASYPNNYWASGGDVWLSAPTMGSYSASAWQAGGFAYATLIHELGHALGLKHPFEDPPVLPTAQDSSQYSVMSYTDHPNNVFRHVTATAGGGYTFSYSSVQPDTPMLYDVAAMQYMYGANTTYKTGNDTYTFDSATPFYRTLWDAGGTDTISVANFTRGCSIDLQPGHFSTLSIVSDALPKGYTGGTSANYDGTDNLAIAFGCTIENAIGGSGNDTLIGNSADNQLSGGAGDDTLNGGLGNDVIDGGDGVDIAVLSGVLSSYTVSFNATANLYTVSGAQSGTDTYTRVEYFQFADLSRTASQLALASLTLAGTASNDVLLGGTGNDTINALAGNDRLTGSGGNDALDGGLGTDTALYSGARSSYTVTANTTGYTVAGPDGTDTLVGIERLEFTNETLALDISGNAGQAYRLYRAAFDRVPENGGLKFWINALDAGYSLNYVANEFISSQEFRNKYGINPTVDQFVTNLYANILHRPYDQVGYDHWTGHLTTGVLTQAQVLAYFAESKENQLAVIGVIQNGIDLFG